MDVFIVLILSLHNFSEPYGVYSALPMATLAMLDCENEYDRCEIWKWRLDGDKIEYAPEYPKAKPAEDPTVAGK